VAGLFVTIKAIIKSMLMLLLLPTTVLAGELENQIEEIQSNTKSFQSVSKKLKSDKGG
jgi:hypothetical protein